MSKIFYKFKSAKDFDTILFDGTAMSAFDLKREIMLGKRLGDGAKIDLQLFDASTNDEFVHDTDMIPRNASVVVKKVPATGPRDASRYLSAAAANSSSAMKSAQAVKSVVGSGRMASSTAPLAEDITPVSAVMGVETIEGSTEEERMQALFQQADAKWQQQSISLAASQQQKGLTYRQQRQMQQQQQQPGQAAHQSQTQPRPQMPTAQAYAAPSMGMVRPPPVNYICNRCGVRGHWIQNCPTLGDQTFDNVKIKQTKGIPKSFLQTVARSHSNQPSDLDQMQSQQQQRVANLMVTPEGDLVVAQVNDQAFKALQQSAAKTFTYDELVQNAREFELNGTVPRGHFQKPELLCRICGLFCRDAVSIACCKSKFCDQCIRNHFYTQLSVPSGYNQMQQFCPACNKPSKLDLVHIEKPTRALVDQNLRRIADEVRKQAGFVPSSTSLSSSEFGQGTAQKQQQNFMNLGSFVTGALNSFEQTRKFNMNVIDTTDQRADFIRYALDRGCEEFAFDLEKKIYVVIEDDLETKSSTSTTSASHSKAAPPSAAADYKYGHSRKHSREVDDDADRDKRMGSSSSSYHEDTHKSISNSRHNRRDGDYDHRDDRRRRRSRTRSRSRTNSYNNNNDYGGAGKSKKSSSRRRHRSKSNDNSYRNDRQSSSGEYYEKNRRRSRSRSRDRSRRSHRH